VRALLWGAHIRARFNAVLKLLRVPDEESRRTVVSVISVFSHSVYFCHPRRFLIELDAKRRLPSSNRLRAMSGSRRVWAGRNLPMKVAGRSGPASISSSNRDAHVAIYAVSAAALASRMLCIGDLMVDVLTTDVCVCFITAGPITKLFAWGEEESGGHVL
jgi:hypothetical protein